MRGPAKAARSRGLTGYDLVEKVASSLQDDVRPHTYASSFLDALGDNDGRTDIADWKIIGLPEEHFRYFDKDHDGLLDVDESTFWYEQRGLAHTMDLSEVSRPPKGHLERLGSWGLPLPNEDLIYAKPFPHPRDFWRKHMDGYRPALLKGAQEGWPCMNWSKDVLKERFGWVDAKVEPKVEGRSNDTAYKDLEKLTPTHRVNLSTYLDIEEGRNIYVVSTVPQEMAWEVAHPSSLLCGSRQTILDRGSKPRYRTGPHPYPHEGGHSWMTHVFEANLWIASGRTRSQLHFDKEWNVNCLISGRKRWFFLNTFWYSEDLQWSRQNKFQRTDPLNNRWTDWVYLDPDHVDLIVQHKLRDMAYWEFIQEAGDCVFLPYAILHQVEKEDDGLQVAVSWMFLPETIYDEEACKEAPLHEDLPLAAMDTLYMYSGRGLIPQGYNDPLNFVMSLEHLMVDQKAKYLTLDLFTAALTEGASSLAREASGPARIKAMFELVTTYAKEPSRGLRRKELRKVPLRIWAKPAAEGDHEGPLACDVGQEYFFCENEEFQRMEKAIQEHLRRRPVLESPQQSPAPLLHTRVWSPTDRPPPLAKQEL